MRKQEALNTFTEGMVMDLNPITTPNNVLTHCLNGTIITFNGNEYVLQNDMGNGRVETAYLPEGYVPMGTAELGGIIYVVSYNPLIDKCQIGCFPSPERNITTNELLDKTITISNGDFQNNGKLTTLMIKLDLLEGTQFEKLNPGDRFKIFATSGLNSNKGKITDLGNTSHIYGSMPKNLRIHVAAIDDNNKITYLDNNLKWYTSNDYFIEENRNINSVADLDAYRNLVSSAYDVFRSKVSGKLCIIAELEVIDSYNATWSAGVVNDSTLGINFKHSWSSKNWNDTRDINPKWIILNNQDKTVGTIVKEPEVNSWSQENAHTFAKNPDTKKGIWNYSLTPAMAFGALEHLTIKGSIDLDAIGSGKIVASEYRYYRNTDSMLLSWGLEAYPEPGHSIDSVEFKFIPNCDKLKEFTFIKSGLSSYAGNFLDEIPLDTELNSYKFKGTLVSDHLYMLLITVKYKDDAKPSGDTSKYKYYTRWFYTASVFNKHYLDKTYNDFKEIPLDFLEFTKQVTQNLVSESINTEEDIPQLTWSEGESPAVADIPQKTLGALILKPTATVHVDIKATYKEDYNIFAVSEDKVSVNNTLPSTASIEHSGQIITTEDGTPSIGVEELLLSDDYKDGKTNKVTVTYKPTDSSTQKHFDTIFTGEEYNKICANNKEGGVMCNYSGVMTPLLYTTDSSEKFGLTFEENHFYFKTYYGLRVGGEKYVHGSIHRITADSKGLSTGSEEALASSGKMVGEHPHNSDATQTLLKAAGKDCGKNIFPVTFVSNDASSDAFNKLGIYNSSHSREYAPKWVWDSKPTPVLDEPIRIKFDGNAVQPARYPAKKSTVMALACKASDDNYYILNMFAPWYNSGREQIVPNGKIASGATFGDILANILNQLYVVNSDEQSSRPLDVIKNISYIEKYNTIWKVLASTKLKIDKSTLQIQCPIDRSIIEDVRISDLRSAVSKYTTKIDDDTDNKNVSLADSVIAEFQEDFEIIYDFLVKNSAYFTYKNQGNSGGSLNQYLVWIDGKMSPAELTSISKDKLYVRNLYDKEKVSMNQVTTYQYLTSHDSISSQNNNVLFKRKEAPNYNDISGYYLSEFKYQDGDISIKQYKVGSNNTLQLHTQESWWMTGFYGGIYFDNRLKLVD